MQDCQPVHRSSCVINGPEDLLMMKHYAAELDGSQMVLMPYTVAPSKHLTRRALF